MNKAKYGKMVCYIYIYIYIYINILYINRETGFGATLFGTISIHGSMIGQGCQSC